MNSGKNLQHHLQLNTLFTSTCQTPVPVNSPIQVFSNIEMDGVLICGKQDTGAEVNAMLLNVYGQLNKKLDGKLELKSCNNIKVIGYSKQSMNIVGKISITCTHANIIKKCNFFVTDIIDTKVILGLQFCRAFNLVKINCDDNCVWKHITVDITNSEFPRGLDPGNTHSTNLPKPPPVDVNLKLRPDCKAHVMEFYPDLFEGVSTIQGAKVKLDVDPNIPSVVQCPRKIQSAMVKPLKKEIDHMLNLGVIQKLDINEAMDWCHNLVLVHKPNGKLRVYLDPCTINEALRFNVHNARTFQDITSSIRSVKKVSKIDANSGFWTLPMDPDSQLFTTFNTPWGKYCFVKMPVPKDKTQLASFLGMCQYLSPYIPRLSDVTSTL